MIYQSVNEVLKYYPAICRVFCKIESNPDEFTKVLDNLFEFILKDYRTIYGEHCFNTIFGIIDLLLISAENHYNILPLDRIFTYVDSYCFEIDVSNNEVLIHEKHIADLLKRAASVCLEKGIPLPFEHFKGLGRQMHSWHV